MAEFAATIEAAKLAGALARFALQAAEAFAETACTFGAARAKPAAAEATRRMKGSRPPTSKTWLTSSAA